MSPPPLPVVAPSPSLHYRASCFLQPPSRLLTLTPPPISASQSLLLLLLRRPPPSPSPYVPASSRPSRPRNPSSAAAADPKDGGGAGGSGGSGSGDSDLREGGPEGEGNREEEKMGQGLSMSQKLTLAYATLVRGNAFPPQRPE
jgi:hypothetical protein